MSEDAFKSYKVKIINLQPDRYGNLIKVDMSKPAFVVTTYSDLSKEVQNGR